MATANSRHFCRVSGQRQMALCWLIQILEFHHLTQCHSYWVHEYCNFLRCIQTCTHKQESQGRSVYTVLWVDSNIHLGASAWCVSITGTCIHSPSLKKPIMTSCLMLISWIFRDPLPLVRWVEDTLANWKATTVWPKQWWSLSKKYTSTPFLMRVWQQWKHLFNTVTKLSLLNEPLQCVHTSTTV